MAGLKYDVRRFSSLSAMSSEAAEYVSGAVGSAIEKNKGICTLALPGGRSVRQLYERLGKADYRSRIQWDSLRIFFGDERYVSHDSEESNFRTLKTNLLSRVKIRDDFIFRVPVDKITPEESAVMYERILREEFLKLGSEHMRGGFPSFDIMILGVGEDGHTASLFPGSAALDEREKWAVYVRGGPGLETRDRITLTMPVLNSSAKVVFIVSGREKEITVTKILSLEKPLKSFPASNIRGLEETVWFIDESGWNLTRR